MPRAIYIVQACETQFFALSQSSLLLDSLLLEEYTLLLRAHVHSTSSFDGADVTATVYLHMLFPKVICI